MTYLTMPILGATWLLHTHGTEAEHIATYTNPALAQRAAELLNRHGLTDTPLHQLPTTTDTTEGR